MIHTRTAGDVELIDVESEHLTVTIVPSMGGKLYSIYNKKLKREFLWINREVEFRRLPAGSEYDPNFIGGIDELIPNDVPETIDGIKYPDHGELWTTALDHIIDDEKVTVHGVLPLSGLYYSKTISLSENDPSLIAEYQIRNDNNAARHFLWKLHAALQISEGDKLVTPAKNGLVVDPEYSRFKNERKAFKWPVIEGTDASFIPGHNNTMDFFYLYDMETGNMQLHSKAGKVVFGYEYDVSVFPFQWWFASYGGFLNHYTAVLEPCTNMPISVNEALEQQQSAFLQPGASLTTRVRLFAGEKIDYLPL